MRERSLIRDDRSSSGNDRSRDRHDRSPDGVELRNAAPVMAFRKRKTLFPRTGELSEPTWQSHETEP